MHTLTFSQCPSSPIVLDYTPLPVTEVATPGQQGGKGPHLWECLSQGRRTVAAVDHLVMFPFFQRLEPMVFLQHPQFWGAHHAVTPTLGKQLRWEVLQVPMKEDTEPGG